MEDQTSLWPAHSAFAQRWIYRFPAWIEAFEPEKALLCVVSDTLEALLPEQGEAEIKRQLRLTRQRLMLEIMRRDLLGLATLQEVTHSLSLMADHLIDVACRWAHEQMVARYGEPADQDSLIIIGMGKLGGKELNVSSDVDLIFTYGCEKETAGGPTGKKLSHAEFFAHVGKRVINLISDPTEDGFVFRVDMRLRPNGDSGPLVASLDMLEEYFFVQGREWERYAWIKSRVVNRAARQALQPNFDQQCNALEKLKKPFVFRRYLDFGAIRALRDLHHQIRQEVRKRERGQDAGSVHVKLGRGGIREIEFMAQVFQLIRGGREPELQIRATLDVLKLCAQKGLIEEEVRDKLTQAYDFWRRLEHRLQYVEDAQTHLLPADEGVRQQMAIAMGLQTTESLNQAIQVWQDFVDQQFQWVFSDKQDDEHDEVSATQWPQAWIDRFSNVVQAQSRWSDLLNSPRYKSLPQAHRERLDRLLPALVQACTEAADPDTAWSRSVGLLESIARRGAYLSLLDEFPAARTRVVRLLSASEWAANYLKSHPILLDEMLDERNLYARPDWPLYEADLRKSLNLARLPDGSPDLEVQMNLTRELHHTQVFRLLAQDLEGYWTVEHLSDQLSELADSTLAAILDEAWKQVPKRHTDHPKFAIVAYGKLGGKELGYASDLDIIFLFDDPHPQAADLYAKLAQRMSRWLSTQTSAGILFETDFRLRPNGAAGLLVSSLQAFDAYQKREGGVGAWVWEHQALTRARYCVGDRELGEGFEKCRVEVLRTPRNIPALALEVMSMRKRMHEGHPNPTDLFDIKHNEGGMVDIEFIVQFLVLAHSPQHAELTANVGNIALLKRCAALGLIEETLATDVGDAYRSLRAKQHAMRLDGKETPRTPFTEFDREIAAVKRLWQETIVAASVQN